VQRILIFVICIVLANASIERFEPKTFKLKKDAVIKDIKTGKVIDIWHENMLFTAYEKKGKMIKLSGYFPNGKWKKADSDMWIEDSCVDCVFRPKIRKRPSFIKRYIDIDKSNFELKVIEKVKNTKKVLYKTKVALGIDRCLPKSEGGKCYYTEPGSYKIRWKIYDSKGIQWCIPKSMEKEKKYKNDLKRNKRCFRGSIGKYALNIGKTYAIHGTSNPASIGKKASHGCIRAKNYDMKKIYSLMQVGDKVYIHE